MRLLVLIGAIGCVALPASSAWGVTPGDQRIASRAQVLLSDLAAGWRTAPDTSSKSRSKCLGPPTRPTGRSDRNFAKGETATLWSSVGVFRTESQAKRVFSTLTSDRVWDCIASELRKTSGAKSVEQGRTLLGKIGAPAVGREIVFVVEQSGIRASGFIHLGVARKGRTVVLLFNGDVFSPPLTSSEETTLLSRMVARVMGSSSSPAANPGAGKGTRKSHDLSFRGNGGKTLSPFRIAKPSTLFWTASGGIFQIFRKEMSGGGSVNSQASRGATYMPPGRYTLTVNAIGMWTIRIAPGVERPQRISPGFVGFRGNGGRELPPFTTPRGATLYWRASGGIFQLFSAGFNGPDVNSQGSRGSTYMERGRHAVTVNALGPWTIYWRP